MEQVAGLAGVAEPAACSRRQFDLEGCLSSTRVQLSGPIQSSSHSLGDGRRFVFFADRHSDTAGSCSTRGRGAAAASVQQQDRAQVIDIQTLLDRLSSSREPALLALEWPPDGFGRDQLQELGDQIKPGFLSDVVRHFARDGRQGSKLQVVGVDLRETPAFGAFRMLALSRMADELLPEATRVYRNPSFVKSMATMFSACGDLQQHVTTLASEHAVGPLPRMCSWLNTTQSQSAASDQSGQQQPALTVHEALGSMTDVFERRAMRRFLRDELSKIHRLHEQVLASAAGRVAKQQSLELIEQCIGILLTDVYGLATMISARRPLTVSFTGELHLKNYAHAFNHYLGSTGTGPATVHDTRCLGYDQHQGGSSGVQVSTRDLGSAADAFGQWIHQLCPALHGN